MIGLKGDILKLMVVSNLEVYIYGLDNIQGKMQMMMVITEALMQIMLFIIIGTLILMFLHIVKYRFTIHTQVVWKHQIL